jgi:hypothetical protein
VPEKPGRLPISAHEPHAADLLKAYVARRWTAMDLRPPPEESWSAVKVELAHFVEECLTKVKAPGPFRVELSNAVEATGSAARRMP